MQVPTLIDQLLSFCAEARDDIVLAKDEYFMRTGGKVTEEDRSFEHRMQGFFNWYLFDRRDKAELTPVQRYLQARGAQLSPSDRELLQGATRSRHSLFAFRGHSVHFHNVKPSCVRVRDVFIGDDFDVLEVRPLLGVEHDDLFEARLIPTAHGLLFSTAFVFHPRLARAAILREIKRRKKKVATLDPEVFCWEIDKMALLAERFRNVPLDAIYNFDTPFLGHKSPSVQGEVHHG